MKFHSIISCAILTLTVSSKPYTRGKYSYSCPRTVVKGQENQTITCSMKCFGNGKLVSCADLQADGFPIYGSFDKSKYVIKDAKTGENVEWKQI